MTPRRSPLALLLAALALVLSGTRGTWPDAVHMDVLAALVEGDGTSEDRLADPCEGTSASEGRDAAEEEEEEDDDRSGTGLGPREMSHLGAARRAAPGVPASTATPAWPWARRGRAPPAA